MASPSGVFSLLLVVAGRAVGFVQTHRHVASNGGITRRSSRRATLRFASGCTRLSLGVGPQKRKADLLGSRVLPEQNLSHDPKQVFSGPSSRKACEFISVSPSAGLAALRRSLVTSISAASFRALQRSSCLGGGHERPDSIQGFGGGRHSRRARCHGCSSSPGNLVAQPGAPADVQPSASLRAARG